MILIDAIPDGALVAMDTMGWIYEFEANPTFGPIVRPVFAAIGSGRLRAGASMLVLGELLVRPLELGRVDLANAYSREFTARPVLNCGT